jgi:hypothetical protein
MGRFYVVIKVWVGMDPEVIFATDDAELALEVADDAIKQGISVAVEERDNSVLIQTLDAVQIARLREAPLKHWRERQLGRAERKLHEDCCLSNRYSPCCIARASASLTNPRSRVR